MPGELVIERPTLMCLGFQWYTAGDDNKNARATVKFRRAGDTEWKAGLDLWRLNGQRCISYRGEEHDFYEPSHMFVGSLFDLEPDTEYECILTMIDPDGVGGAGERSVKVMTRRVPQPPADSRVFRLGGTKSDFSDFRGAVAALNPGDTLLFLNGNGAHGRFVALRGTQLVGETDGQAVLDQASHHRLAAVLRAYIDAMRATRNA